MTAPPLLSLDAPPAAAAPTPEARIAAEIVALADLDLVALRARWRQLTRRPAPEHLGRALLLRLVAYRLQAQALGDLDRDTVRYLDAVHAEQQRRRREGTAGAVPRVPAVPDRRRGRLRPGTLLVREHGGRVHRVMAMAGGFAYEGATYQSLSEIARLITGTSWNGPRFFGLRERERERAGRRGRGGEAAAAAPTSTEGGQP